MKIYVASSWRNLRQPSVVECLRQAGFEVYDFKNPPGNTGFSWSSIDPNWREWNAEVFLGGLGHPLAKAGFDEDMHALRAADACVLVLPCGRSAHLELGWAAGAGKQTFVLLDDPISEPELMYRMCSGVFANLEDLLAGLKCSCGLEKDLYSQTGPGEALRGILT